MILTDKEAIKYIKANKAVSEKILKAREQSKKLFALLEGEDFLDELINKIEHIESADKAKARKKYSRSIMDFYERLLQPVSNVFSATGGTKKYDLKDKQLELLLGKIGNIRGGKSIERYLDEVWMDLYHTDPNGVIFLEYTTRSKTDVWCTYKSIGSIRNYIESGQLTEVILFEPRVDSKGVSHWRIVDDTTDRTFIEHGNSFILDEDHSFEHPFGQPPAIIISNITSTKTQLRLSPIHKVVELSKEYARDQSILTLYKFLHGYPIHWRYVNQCKKCTGQRKDGTDNCPDCDGKGYIQNKDVTDMVTLPIPDKDGIQLAPNIAGNIAPDLKTWTQYHEELDRLEFLANFTHWGTSTRKGDGTETATGRFIDVQPVKNRLNKYSNVTEFMEWKLTEWCANFLIPNKDKNLSISMIAYGRRYIIESPDTILNRYEEAKKAGDNSVILDRLFEEFLTAKYKNDPVWLRVELTKFRVQPFPHLSIEQVNTIFGQQAAGTIVLFGEFWEQADKTRTLDELNKDFETFVQDEDERKKLTEIDKVRKLLNQISPLVATKVLEQMSSEEVREIVNLKGEKALPPTPE